MKHQAWFAHPGQNCTKTKKLSKKKFKREFVNTSLPRQEQQTKVTDFTRGLYQASARHKSTNYKVRTQSPRLQKKSVHFCVKEHTSLSSFLILAKSFKVLDHAKQPNFKFVLLNYNFWPKL
jgi:hypothetical protein